jgi:hypothetical protein
MSTSADQTLIVALQADVIDPGIAIETFSDWLAMIATELAEQGRSREAERDYVSYLSIHLRNMAHHLQGRK